MEDHLKKLKMTKEYWSKADAFLLPLTGLNRNETYEMRSYLFWNEYSIENYHFILTFQYDEDYDSFLQYAKTYIFPVLDKKNHLIESYDVKGMSIFILDMSEWAMDIEMVLKGKYSLLTKAAKAMIEKFHITDGHILPVHIFGVLYPNIKVGALDGKTSFESVAEGYNIDIDILMDIGEIGSLYDKMPETLLTDINFLCQIDT